MASEIWQSVFIKDKDNKTFEAIAPVIISASRRTDIPAFFPKWFMNRLKTGYLKWKNPFNNKYQYVSFHKTRCIVFWTKNARPLFPYLGDLEKKNINYYFQFTLNNYENEKLEPFVPDLKSRIETFQELSNRIGKERVVWRFDPLLLTKQINVDKLVEKVYSVGKDIHKYTSKLVISFADISNYKKVQSNLTKEGVQYIEFDEDKMVKAAEGISKLNKEWELKVVTCCEELDFNSYYIGHNKCIDDELIVNSFGSDRELMDFLGYKGEEGSLFGGDKGKYVTPKRLKDKGQRKQCLCIISKDIGEYNTCKHLCLYCYANSSKGMVLKNINLHSERNESITG